MNKVYHFLRSRRALLCTCLLLISTMLSAQFYFDETCRNTTGVFIPGGNAPGYTANGMGDTPGNGWLRLTNLNTGQAGFVKFANTFPSTMGVTIEFDFKVYGTQPYGWYDGLADGFSVFLFDGAYLNSFQIGESGGSLGYKNMPHAYVGIGLDEYSNFNGTLNGSGKSKISVLNANYQPVGATPPYLGLSAATQDGHLEYMTMQTTRPTDAQYYRRIKIDIEPNGTGGMKVNVYLRKALNTTYIHLLTDVQLTTPVPALFGMGFGASTGSGVAYHEVRDLIARTPGDLYVYMPEMPCLSVNPNDTTTIPIHIVNGLGPADSIKVCDTLPQYFNLLGLPTATATNGTVDIVDYTQTPLPDGRLLCCYMLNMSSYGEVVMNYIGNFDATTHPQSFTVGSSITPPPGYYIDFDTTDNRFTLTIPLVRLDTATICHGESYTQGGNTFTESGDYMLVFQAITGCDSIVYLHLTVSDAAYFELVDTITLCNGDIGFGICLTSCNKETGDSGRTIEDFPSSFAKKLFENWDCSQWLKIYYSAQGFNGIETMHCIETVDCATEININMEYKELYENGNLLLSSSSYNQKTKCVTIYFSGYRQIGNGWDYFAYRFYTIDVIK